MDFEELKALDDASLRAEIRRLPRAVLDEQLNVLSGRRSLMVQKLEALFTPGRESVFAAIRPGGIEDIEKAIEQAPIEAVKERALLTTYRDFNRVLLHFMDAYEERVFSDLEHMSQEELQTLYTSAHAEKKRSEEILKTSKDYRKTQDASGILRLAGLFETAITKQLQQRFGAEPSV